MVGASAANGSWVGLVSGRGAPEAEGAEGDPAAAGVAAPGQGLGVWTLLLCSGPLQAPNSRMQHLRPWLQRSQGVGTTTRHYLLATMWLHTSDQKLVHVISHWIAVRRAKAAGPCDWLFISQPTFQLWWYRS